MSCTPPMAPASMANNTGLNTTDITTKWGLFLDVVTAAADVRSHARHHDRRAQGAGTRAPTRPARAQLGYYHSEDASGGTWHGLAHDFSNANSRRLLKGINAWIASEVFAKLLAKLDVPEMGGTHLPRQLARLLGQRARLQPHRVQRAVPAGGRRGRLHQAGPLHRLHRLGRARLLRAGERQRHQGDPAQPVPGDRAAGDGARARRLRDRRQGRLRFDQRQRPRPPTPGRSTTTCRRSGRSCPASRASAGHGTRTAAPRTSPRARRASARFASASGCVSKRRAHRDRRGELEKLGRVARA